MKMIAILAATFGLIALVPAAAQASPVHYHSRSSYEAAIGRSVLSTINAERRAHHLRPVSNGVRLQLSARRHSFAMATHNVMSHQCSGERSLGSRITATGFHWRYIEENVAWNSQMNTAGVLAMQRYMYAEKAPDDGHKVNILSSRVDRVGVDVYLDTAHHKIWLTEDFGHKM